MTPRDMPEQLSLSAAADNDVSLDDVLGPSRRVSAGDRALAAQAGPDGAAVAAKLASRRSNQARGRVAQRHGAEFEAWLTAQHIAAALPGRDRLLAWHLHVEAAAKYFHDRRSGEKRLKHVAKAHADFVAQSTRAWGSRTIVVEAKSVYGAGERLSLEDLEPQQRAHLTAAWQEGGIAVLAVEFREPGPKGHVDTLRRFAMAWGDIPWRPVRKGSWSIGAEDCAGYEVPPETGPKRASYLLRFLRSA